MLKDCLALLGHDVVEIEFDPSLPPDPPGFDFCIYPHKTRQEAPEADLFYKEMHMQGLFTIDRNGWGPDHSGLQVPPDLRGIDPNLAESFCRGLREEFLVTGLSKHCQPPFRAIAPDYGPYLMAPLQLPTDDAVMLHSPLSVLEFVQLLAAWAERVRFTVVFKLHPGAVVSEVAEAVRLRAAASRYVVVLEENIHALIAAASGVVVLTSGVGFESLIHGKPVVTFGQCDYRWATFRGTAETMDAAFSYVNNYTPAQRQAAFALVYFYYHQHAYDTSANTLGCRERLLTYLEKVVKKEPSLSPSRRDRGQCPHARRVY
jgi:hypothetical protein